jgi:MoaA/NifB/PqqE/SkfB family radical SAM enzyme
MIKQLLNTDRHCLNKFIFNMGYKGLKAFNNYEKGLKNGQFFPAFHFISVTDECNLHCQGCWVTGKKDNHTMSAEDVDRIITETKQKGSYFFGILGGEPLMYKPLISIFEKHSDCYFQLFTNGTLLNKEIADKLRKCANVTPLISFEGDEKVADVRRGGTRVFQRTTNAIEAATKSRLITGVAISVCQSNFEMALSHEFIQSMIDRKVCYLWYYIFRPAGENASPELALTPVQLNQLRRHLIAARSKYAIAIIDTYWNEKGEGFCPAAKGLSHHINASGFIEPCPVIQFATDHIIDNTLTEIYKTSPFLNDFRIEIPKQTRGCIVMEDPQWLVSYIDKYSAADTSGRDNERERLLAMKPVNSHGSCDVIPEKGFIYKFAKKHAFFGLGAYG